HFFHHHMCTDHAGTLVDEVLAEATQRGDGGDEADTIQRLLGGIFGDTQVCRHRQLADIVLQQCVDHFGDLAAQAFAVAAGCCCNSASHRLCSTGIEAAC